MGLIDFIFGIGNNSTKVKDLIQKGAIIIDVRTTQEFKNGHIKDSQNIPLQIFTNKVGEIKKFEKPIILCCASGGRSAQATSILKKQGIECINGGGWQRLSKLLISR